MKRRFDILSGREVKSAPPKVEPHKFDVGTLVHYIADDGAQFFAKVAFVHSESCLDLLTPTMFRLNNVHQDEGLPLDVRRERDRIVDLSDMQYHRNTWHQAKISHSVMAITVLC